MESGLSLGVVGARNVGSLARVKLDRAWRVTPKENCS